MSPADLLAAARGLLPPLEGGREDLLLPLYQVGKASAAPSPAERGRRIAGGVFACDADPLPPGPARPPTAAGHRAGDAARGGGVGLPAAPADVPQGGGARSPCRARRLALSCLAAGLAAARAAARAPCSRCRRPHNPAAPCCRQAGSHRAAFQKTADAACAPPQPAAPPHPLTKPTPFPKPPPPPPPASRAPTAPRAAPRRARGT